VLTEERVLQGIFDPACSPYRNAPFSIPKQNGKYCLIISAVSVNQYTMENPRTLPNVEQCSEGFA
jgi:hypothetical protein